ncbi:hypothetical protein [Parafilimonas sp.]|uniref:hypothetical protein n=1 Tax=Parafilimonas sp. TaxID=1969739 RepID=UPI0039E48863
MLTTNDVARIYDTILSIPGMSEMVKIDMKVSRKNVLLLYSVIKRGLTVKDDDKSYALLESIPQGVHFKFSLAQEVIRLKFRKQN